MKINFYEKNKGRVKYASNDNHSFCCYLHFDSSWLLFQFKLTMKGYITIPKYQEALTVIRRYREEMNRLRDELLEEAVTKDELEERLKMAREDLSKVLKREHSAYMGWLSAIVMMIISLVILGL